MLRFNLQHTELRPDGLRFDPIAGVLLAPVSRLRPSPDNPRLDFDSKSAKAELKKLRADIDSWRESGRGLCGTGLMEPLKGRWAQGAFDGNGNVKKNALIHLFDGERRFRVTHEDYPWLPITLDNVTEKEARDAALRTSLQKQLLSPLEEAHAFSQKMQGENWTTLQCAKHYSVGEGYVSNRVELLECSPATQKMVEEIPETMSHALLLRDWKGRISADDEKELIPEIKDGLTVKALRAEVEKRAGELKSKRESAHAPDRETQSRASTHSRTGGGNVSRGREVKSHSLKECRQEAELSFQRAAINLETARGWLENLADHDRQKFSNKYAFALRARLKEMFPEIP